MSQRNTLADAKAARLPEAWNIASTDSRFVAILNEATRRCLYRGDYWATFGTYSVTAASRFMALPPRLDSIRAINVASSPTILRSRLHQFLANGWGSRDLTATTGSGIEEVMFQGAFPTDLAMTADSIVTVTCDLAGDVGETVTIFGKDANGNWVRTPAAAPTQDGETIALAQGAGTPSITTFSEIDDIIAPTTLTGQWYLYEGTVAAGTLIGEYEKWDQKPAHQRFLVPWVSATVTTVEVIGKLAYIPVAVDNDFLIIQNLTALKYAGMAILADERSDFDTGMKLMLLAQQELEFELSHHTSGFKRGINITGPGYGYGDTREYFQ